MKILSAVTLSFLAVTSVVGRNCPVESTCIQEECTNFQINNLVNLGDFDDTQISREKDFRRPVLEADCKDRWGTKVFTWLRLDQCIMNNKGEMHWSYNGDSNCRYCKIKQRKADSDPVVMQCLCPDGGEVFEEINLSEGIWHYDGTIGCYNWAGTKRPIDPVKKRSLAELPADATIRARDDEDLGLHIITAADFVGSNHRRAPAEPREVPDSKIEQDEQGERRDFSPSKRSVDFEDNTVGGPKARDEVNAEDTRRFRRF